MTFLKKLWQSLTSLTSIYYLILMSKSSPFSAFFLLLFLFCANVYAQYSWKSVQLYGGGYVPGITFHPNGDGYIRTDVGGAYSLNADGSWTPLNDAFTSGNDMGSIAIAIDESDANALYTTGGLYPELSWCGGGSFIRSANKGKTWTKIPLTTANVPGATNVNGDNALCLNGNWGGRGTGNRIAAKGNTIYFATNQNGLLKSTNKGSNWTILTVASIAKESGFTAVFIDKNDNVYAAPNGGGLYRSTDDGSSWNQVSGVTGTVYQMVYNSTGNAAFITTNTGEVLDQGTASGGKLFKLNAADNTVAEITNLPSSSGGLVGLAVNSADVNEIAVATSATWDGSGTPWSNMTPHGYIYYTTDGGANWKDILKPGTFDASSSPYVNHSNPHWISAVGIDPKNSGRIFFGTGFGMLSTENAKADQPAWKFSSKGIEETVALGLASTKFGAALVSVLGDVDGAYYANLDSPPADRHKVSGNATVGTIYDLDYAGLHPNFMVMVHKNSEHKYGAFSKDGGKTWTDFASNPPNVTNNEVNFIAVSADAKRIAWNVEAQGIYSSADSGKTWQQHSGTTGFSKFRVISDKVAPSTFYLYNPSTGILHKNTSGTTWSEASSSQLAKSSDGDWAWGYFRLFVSPFAEGEIWATQGAQIPDVMWLSGEGIGGVKRSTDGGSTFEKINGIEFAKYIGFGKGIDEGNPAVYFTGMASSGTVNNIYRSENYLDWTQIDDAEHKYGEVTMIIGDPCIYSRVYLGTSGRGIIYGEEEGNENTCQEREDNGYITPMLNISANRKAIESIRLYFDGTRIKIQKNLPNGEAKTFDLKGSKLN
jgi:photosystem II stability/assembly factor-like uncharacterized protein